MIPCSACHRHIRASELACPFCGAALRSTEARSPLLAMAIVGAFAIVGCASDPPASGEDEAGSTTGPGTTDESDTIVDESSDDDPTTTTTTSTSTSTSNGSDTVDDGWDDNGGSFYAGPDDNDSTTTGDPFECDPVEQDCPEGEKCVPFASLGTVYDANKCVPVFGDGEPGEPCTSQGPATATDDCNEASVCMFLTEVEGEFFGECLSFCTGSLDAPSCAGDEQCEISNRDSVAVCVPRCDPLAQDCSAGAGCYHDLELGFVCLPAGDIATNQPCSLPANDCAPGNDCVAGLPNCDANCCSEFCELGNPEACMATPGTNCVPFFELGMAPAGYEDVGICLVP